MKGLLNIFVLLQKLVPSTKHFIRVKIVYSFKRNPDPGLTYLQKEPGNQFLLRSIYSTRDKPNIASFTLNKHLLLSVLYTIQKLGLLSSQSFHILQQILTRFIHAYKFLGQFFTKRP